MPSLFVRMRRKLGRIFRWPRRLPPRARSSSETAAASTMTNPPSSECDASGPSPLRPPNVSAASGSPDFSSNYYAGSHGFTIESQSITTIRINDSQPRTLFEYLSPHVAHGAAHDSKDRRDEPACDEETRTAIRDDIISWIKHDGGDSEVEPKRIMWLSGPAGAGKSAIAGTVAETCKSHGLLAASFFFSSFSPSTDRRSIRGFIATLALHMSQNAALTLYKKELLSALENRPDIFHKNLKEQSEHLIMGPFANIQRGEVDRTGWPRAIIVDGVDEVVATQDGDRPMIRKSEEDQNEVLDVLLRLSGSPRFPFRIFIASRPERNISDFFADAQPPVVSLFLDSKYDPDADIRTYLASRFAKIRRQPRFPDSSWPGKDIIDRIVDMSSGQFIVPATIIRWVEAGVPQAQLEEVMKLERDRIASRNPFAPLDNLYQHILRRAKTPESDSRLVIKWILSITSGGDLPGKFWKMMFEDHFGELDHRMAPISSLISIPPPDDTFSPIQIYHKSLIDFISTEQRSLELHVEPVEHASFMANRVVGVLKEKGPAVSASSEVDLNAFLFRFLTLDAVVRKASENCSRLRDMSAIFLDFLSETENTIDTLSSCDVEWWAGFCLQSGTVSPNRAWFIRGMYVGIHQAMKCDVNTSPTPTSTTEQRGHKPECHPACIRWRTGIIAKAKELGWCVHEIEEVPLEDLHNVSLDEATAMFKRPAPRDPTRCHFCHPAAAISSA